MSLGGSFSHFRRISNPYRRKSSYMRRIAWLIISLVCRVLPGSCSPVTACCWRWWGRWWQRGPTLPPSPPSSCLTSRPQVSSHICFFLAWTPSKVNFVWASEVYVVHVSVRPPTHQWLHHIIKIAWWMCLWVCACVCGWRALSGQSTLTVKGTLLWIRG